LNQYSDSLDNHHRVHRKPAPGTAGQSMLPAGEPPSRAAPQIPPYEAINRYERPAPGEYGRIPGTSENAWAPPPVLNRPMTFAGSSPSPSLLTNPTPQTYVGDVNGVSRPRTQQNNQSPAFNDIRLPAPRQNPWDVSQIPRPQPEQSGQLVNKLPASNTAGAAPRAHTDDFNQIPRPGTAQYAQYARYGEGVQAANDERSGRRPPYEESSHIPRPRPQQNDQNGQDVQGTQAEALPYRLQPEAQRKPTNQPPLPRQPQNQPMGAHLTQPPAIPSQKVPAPRSVSQPPETRRESLPSQPSNRLQKTSQPNSSASRPARSADASPRRSPPSQARDKSDPQAAPPTSSDLNVLHVSNQPNSYHSDSGSSDGRGSKRPSWIPGVKSRQTSQDLTSIRDGADACILDGRSRNPYDLQPLINAQKVELLPCGISQSRISH
jgi:hypothetical protein